MYNEIWCGNLVKQEVSKWSLLDFRSESEQPLADLYVEQQHRLDEIKDMAENHMHHRGALWDDAAMIDLLRNRTPEDLWDWMKETGVDPDDGTHTALELAEKLDHKHKQAIKKAEQKKEAEKKEQQNEKLDNNGENKRANADVDNPVDIRSNKRRCLCSESDDDSKAINESSSSAEESSSSDKESSSGDEQPSSRRRWIQRGR